MSSLVVEGDPVRTRAVRLFVPQICVRGRGITAESLGEEEMNGRARALELGRACVGREKLMGEGLGREGDTARGAERKLPKDARGHRRSKNVT